MGSWQVPALTDKTRAQWHLGLGVKNTQMASKKRGELGRWKEVTGGDTVGVPTIPPWFLPILFPHLGNDPDAVGSVL